MKLVMLIAGCVISGFHFQGMAHNFTESQNRLIRTDDSRYQLREHVAMSRIVEDEVADEDRMSRMQELIDLIDYEQGKIDALNSEDPVKNLEQIWFRQLEMDDLMQELLILQTKLQQQDTVYERIWFLTKRYEPYIR